MTETEGRPVDCRPVNIEQIEYVDPAAPGYQLHGINIARVSRGKLLRFARRKNIQVDGDTKIDIYHAIAYHLRQIGWPADRDLSKLRKS